MKRVIICGVLISVILMSCTKPATTPVNQNTTRNKSTGWKGTYTGNGGGNTINQVVVDSIGASTVKMQLQMNVSGVFYTFATIEGATLSDSVTASINENGMIYGYTDTYHFAGSAIKNGNTLTVSGTATGSGGSNTQTFYFYGSK